MNCNGHFYREADTNTFTKMFKCDICTIETYYLVVYGDSN